MDQAAFFKSSRLPFVFHAKAQWMEDAKFSKRLAFFLHFTFLIFHFFQTSLFPFKKILAFRLTFHLSRLTFWKTSHFPFTFRVPPSAFCFFILTNRFYQAPKRPGLYFFGLRWNPYFCSPLSGCGEIGRRTRLRIWRREACRFDSYHPHIFEVDKLKSWVVD